MDAHVAVSQEVRDHLKRLGFPCTVISQGIDCQQRTRSNVSSRARLDDPAVRGWEPQAERIEKPHRLSGKRLVEALADAGVAPQALSGSAP